MWLEIEPFSGRPSSLGSFVAATLIGNPQLCVDYARRGLMANPNDTILLNNLAVGLAMLGQLVPARRTWNRAIASADSGQHEITLQATRGLIAFRAMDSAVGRLRYRTALELAIQKGNKILEVMVSLHEAREEMIFARARNSLRPTTHDKVVEQAIDSKESTICSFASKLLKDLRPG